MQQPARSERIVEGGCPRVSVVRTDSPRLSGENLAVHRCSRCGQDDPLEFRANSRMRSGLHSWCKECQRQAVRDWRARNPEYEAAYNERRRVLGTDGFYTKVCVTCGSEFRTKRRHTKICGAGRCREGGLDPELARARRRNANHRRRETYAPPPVELRLTGRDVRDLLAAAPAACPLCGVEMSGRHPEPTQRVLDHIIPLAAGGMHVRENVRVICRACNGARPHDGSDVEGQVAIWSVSA